MYKHIMPRHFLILVLLLFSSITTINAQSSFEVSQPFTQISLRGSIRAELIPAESSSAVITVYGAEQNMIDWNCRNGKLNVSFRTGILDKSNYVDIKIYYNELEYIGIEGVTMKCSEPILGTKLTLESFGGVNKVQMAVNLASFFINVSGKCDLVVRGRTQEADIKAYMGARIDFMQCETEDVYATVSQGSELFIKTSGRLDAKVSTAGNIYYLGSPKLRSKTSLGGAITTITPINLLKDEQTEIEVVTQPEESTEDSTVSQ